MTKSNKNGKLCNFLRKTNCPVDNMCCLNNVIYQAKVSTSENDHKIYIDSTKRTFKSRYNEHRISFLKPSKCKPKNCSQLEDHLLNLNSNNLKYST